MSRRLLKVHYTLSVVRRWHSHFWLLLWNRWTEFNETWQEARSQRPLQSLCFSGRSEKQDGRPSSYCLRHFWLLLWNPGRELGSKISMCPTKFVFFGPIGKPRWPPWPLIGWNIFDFSSETAEPNWKKLDRKQDLKVFYQVCGFFGGQSEKHDCRPGLWFAETFSTSSLKPLNGIQGNLTGSKISTSSTKFVFFGPIGKTRWPPELLLSETLLTSSLKPREGIRKQDLNMPYQVCVFRANRKTKMAALASDWLKHSRFLLWNRWTELEETWQEARSQGVLPSLWFFWGQSEKHDCRPGLWFAETFSTSSLKPLNGIQGNLTGSKISTSSTKFVFFGPIRKTRWPPWPLIGRDILNFSSETAQRNSKKLDRKQDLNML